MKIEVDGVEVHVFAGPAATHESVEAELRASIARIAAGDFVVIYDDTDGGP